MDHSQIRLHITVKGIVIKDNCVLLLKRVRPSSDGHGIWELPGGGLELGERPDQALQREMKEETNLDVEVMKPVYTFTAIRKDYQTVGIGFLCQMLSEDIQISNEHQSYQFVAFDDLPNYLSKEIYQDVVSTIKEYQKENRIKNS